ncbi:hypothetical protein AT746_14330 [Lacimicrobium alkaliphilum]|uniref:Ice-binding protein C-terminal domain-containing protein n=2 Tax=Lacimicrobium alkaliphilum TaxID=1526571 RepID=A0A0U2JJD0_9ALTE|nr:hypothetical protein AT746_14330 [Lacimicrobium alkaliphilum]
MGLKGMKKLYMFSLLALLSINNAFGAIIISGDIVDGTGKFTISNSISFEVIKDGQIDLLYMKNWASPADSSRDFAAIYSEVNISINGVDSTYQFQALADNLLQSFNDITPEITSTYIDTVDGGRSRIPVFTGDIFTIYAGVWKLGPQEKFNPSVFGSFQGEAFLGDMFGNRLTKFVSLATVPEPGTLGLFGLALYAIFRLRRL